MNIKEIQSPKFLKDLNNEQLSELCQDIRLFLLDSISKTGGHLSSNLGIVEVSVELLKVFDAPKDKIIYDVGHQSYVHKILTGRAKDFEHLRQYGGISGFQKRSESEYDSWEAGHSSTSISAAIGLALARDLKGEDGQVIAVIGDGAVASGMALEAINHLASLKSKVIIVLNDNKMSISRPVGAMPKFLSELRVNRFYIDSKHDLKTFLSKNQIGETILENLRNVRDSIKKNLLSSNPLSALGLDYLGPINGHDLGDLEAAFEMAKSHHGSIIVHVVTQKGKGYSYAQNDTHGKWHGIGPFDIQSGNLLQKSDVSMYSYSAIVANELLRYREKNNDLVVLTPAMISGSKLEEFFEKYPESSFDCGIAEEHTITMAGALACGGLKPFVSIYSSFMQRAYDQISHDIARMNLPIVVGIDRAGLVGEDGETHHGVFDIAMLRHIPNLVLCEGKDAYETACLLHTGLHSNVPFFIRYPRGNAKYDPSLRPKDIEIGTFDILCGDESSNLCVFGYGNDLDRFVERVKDKNICVINARFFKPLDTTLLLKLANISNWIVWEEDTAIGGLSSAISEFVVDNHLHVDVHRIGIGDHFVTHGNTALLKEIENISIEKVIDKIEELQWAKD